MVRNNKPMISTTRRLFVGLHGQLSHMSGTSWTRCQRLFLTTVESLELLLHTATSMTLSQESWTN
ncbi:hypothetical protein FOPG_19461 [Fusarium oxysporum f. sp. conglutinans race 2 54008]|uniref:Uncharacterized protein n=1 Tax=Fusarium oxysporum f. sp. conglutinans race 2 54008 TaxID=1089457 RepID=X0GKY1_FUSOX|nr:hypothetical protein FOPG_19461 [Fusarium oxysporum f. sp. conglutinans race 2 54008]